MTQLCYIDLNLILRLSKYNLESFAPRVNIEMLVYYKSNYQTLSDQLTCTANKTIIKK